MPAQKVSIELAKGDKLFYFVANAVVYRESDGRCLILKRSESEKVHPGKWTIPGGKLEHRDLDINHPARVDGEVLNYDNALEELVKREVREESGVEIKVPLVYIGNNTFIRPDGIPVVLMKFAVRYVSGEVEPEDGAFTGAAWVNKQEIDQYDYIDGIDEEIGSAISAFSVG